MSIAVFQYKTKHTCKHTWKASDTIETSKCSTDYCILKMRNIIWTFKIFNYIQLQKHLYHFCHAKNSRFTKQNVPSLKEQKILQECFKKFAENRTKRYTNFKNLCIHVCKYEHAKDKQIRLYYYYIIFSVGKHFTYHKPQSLEAKWHHDNSQCQVQSPDCKQLLIKAGGGR